MESRKLRGMSKKLNGYTCEEECNTNGFYLHLFDELVAERTSGPKVLLLQCHVLFGLRVKGGVLNQTVDKHPHVVLHLDGEGVEHTQYYLQLYFTPDIMTIMESHNAVPGKA